MGFTQKPKKCRGTGDAVGYGCGAETLYRTLGLGTDCKCYQSWLLGSEKGKERMAASILKATAPRIENEASIERAISEKKNTSKLQYLLVNTRNVCHEYIRMRDRGKSCVSCGQLWDKSFHACHFYKAELYSTLKFDEYNIHGGCQKCNLFMDGAESSYRVGLLNRYGQEYVESLDAKAQSEKRGQHKWDREELEKIRIFYKEKIKALKPSQI